MPSRFEPCGLSQMYAQRFGALPIAHRTGGLAETIEDGVTGLLFDRADQPSLSAALERAFDIYGAPRAFHIMRRAAMARRFDWQPSADKYVGDLSEARGDDLAAAPAGIKQLSSPPFRSRGAGQPSANS